MFWVSFSSRATRDCSQNHFYKSCLPCTLGSQGGGKNCTASAHRQSRCRDVAFGFYPREGDYPVSTGISRTTTPYETIFAFLFFFRLFGNFCNVWIVLDWFRFVWICLEDLEFLEFLERLIALKILEFVGGILWGRRFFRTGGYKHVPIGKAAGVVNAR